MAGLADGCWIFARKDLPGPSLRTYMHDVGMATVDERQCGFGLCVYLLGF